MVFRLLISALLLAGSLPGVERSGLLMSVQAPVVQGGQDPGKAQGKRGPGKALGKQGPGKAKKAPGTVLTGVMGRKYCSPTASARPRRIGPGHGGVCGIVLALRSNAVVMPNTRFKVTYKPRQGPLRVARWRRTPARKGTLYKRLEKRLVYDNTMVVQIPFTVAPGTEYGEYRLNVEILTDLHDGETGKSLGPYRDVVSCKVVVGKPIAQPNPPGGAKAAVTPGGKGKANAKALALARQKAKRAQARRAKAKQAAHKGGASAKAKHSATRDAGGSDPVGSGIGVSAPDWDDSGSDTWVFAVLGVVALGLLSLIGYHVLRR